MLLSGARKVAKPKNLGGGVALPTGKFLRVTLELHCKLSDGLESFRRIWKVSRWSRKFPSDLENVQMIWKVSRGSAKLPEDLESV